MTNYLLDGPIMTAPERRAARIEKMAAELICERIFHCDQDAVRFLCSIGYGWLEVSLLVAEARYLAFQDLVAAEMSKA